MVQIPFKRKTVLITGASSGIGLETTKRFAEAGYIVYAAVRNPNKAEALHVLSKQFPKHIIVTQLDLLDSEKAIYEKVKKIGKIDILINNAGIGLIGPAHATTDEERRRVFDTNLFGLLNVTYAVLDGMIHVKAGKIISISSIVGPLPDPKQATYSASKGALEHFMSVLRNDLIQAGYHDIHVANVHPGPVLTNFKNAAQNGSRFTADNNPYPQTASARAEWESIMNEGRPISETVETIYRVAHENHSDFWNPTHPSVKMAFSETYKDTTGNRFMVGLAAPTEDKAAIGIKCKL